MGWFLSSFLYLNSAKELFHFSCNFKECMALAEKKASAHPSAGRNRGGRGGKATDGAGPTCSVILFFTSSPILISMRLRSFSSCWLERMRVMTSSRIFIRSSSSWKSWSLWSSRCTNFRTTIIGGSSALTDRKKICVRHGRDLPAKVLNLEEMSALFGKNNSIHLSYLFICEMCKDSQQVQCSWSCYRYAMKEADTASNKTSSHGVSKGAYVTSSTPPPSLACKTRKEIRGEYPEPDGSQPLPQLLSAEHSYSLRVL